MAFIKVRGLTKVTVSDQQAREIREDWVKMKEGKFPENYIVSIGEFTGEMKLIEGFVIEQERSYPKELPEPEMTPERTAKLRGMYEEMTMYIHSKALGNGNTLQA